MTINTKERQRLAAILGMLGSDQAGERAAAGLQAEAFRQKHGLTWTDLLALQPEPSPLPNDPPPPPYEPPERRRSQPEFQPPLPKFPAINWEAAAEAFSPIAYFVGVWGLLILLGVLVGR
jgi:hypothetical protein